MFWRLLIFRRSGMVAIMNPKFDGHDMLRECTPDSSTLVDKESNRYPKKIAWLHLELNWSPPEKKKQRRGEWKSEVNIICWMYAFITNQTGGLCLGLPGSHVQSSLQSGILIAWPEKSIVLSYIHSDTLLINYINSCQYWLAKLG